MNEFEVAQRHTAAISFLPFIWIKIMQDNILDNFALCLRICSVLLVYKTIKAEIQSLPYLDKDRYLLSFQLALLTAI